MTKKGVLLINLGTPDYPDIKSVRRYLKEFLSDPRVIDLPSIMRWILVNAIILPFRPKQSAAAYQKVWLVQGSPLLVHMQHLKEALTVALGSGYQIEFGMRYGSPGIQQALAKLSHCADLYVLPLFPQYSSAATGSAVAKLMRILESRWNMPELIIKRDFYDDPGFISAYASVIKNNIKDKKIDLILFSYHGLPERHVRKSDCQAVCDHKNACPGMGADNRYCYRAQCFATSKLLADALALKVNEYQTSFQSRLGRTPWIKPYTDLLLPELIQQGIKNIAVVCPSFVCDCLETLEEIGIRAREQWRGLGGGELILIPCLNNDPVWVESLVKLIGCRLPALIR